MAIADIQIEGDLFLIYCPAFDNERARGIPDRKWVKAKGCWTAPVVKSTALHLLNQYRADEFDIKSMAKILELKNIVRENAGEGFPAWFKFNKKPFKKQTEALNKAWSHEEFALFMDMGTGKTFTAINLAAARAMMGQIHALLVLCPSSAKPVYPDEIEDHCPIPYDLHVHEPTGPQLKKTVKWTESPSDRLKILVISIEALSQGSAIDAAMHFCSKYKTMMVIDESSTIKTPPRKRGQKSRTSRSWDLGSAAACRVIMTGTEITQGLQDLYAQFRFLDWRIIGNKNFTSFKARYCQMGGFQGKKIIGYQNVDELMDLIAPKVYQCKITDIHDMPDQVYETRKCEMNPVQKRLLKELGDPFEMATSMGDLELETETVLERMMRYQQIVGGFFPHGVIKEHENKDGELVKLVKYEYEPIEGANPKMEALKQIIDELPKGRKVLIFAAWQAEQDMIRDYVYNTFEDSGGDHHAFYCKRKGFSSTEHLRAETKRFQTDPDCRFMIAGRGGYRAVTWTAADVVIYYSCTFSYDDREQSERRPWRTGRKDSVLYIDLLANHKIDSQIRNAVRCKKDVADFVKERLKEKLK